MSLVSDFFDPSALIAAAQDAVYDRLANVIGSISSGLGGLSSWLQSTYETAKEKALSAFDAGMEFLSDIKDTTISKFGELTNYIGDAISTSKDFIVNTVTSGVSALASAVENSRLIFEQTLTDARGTIIENISNIRTDLSALGNMIIVDIAGKLDPITTDIKTLVSTLTDPDKLGELLVKAIEKAW